MSPKNPTTVLEITSQEEAIRLDSFLAQKFPHMSRSSIKKLIATCVQVNHRAIKPSRVLKLGDKILLDKNFFEEPHLTSSAGELEIVYEDADLLVVNKPAGLLTHPTADLSRDSLANRLITLRKDLPTLQGKNRPGIVHRLDRDTSGLILVAKNENVQKKLIDLFQNKEIHKTYLALVFGKLEKLEETGPNFMARLLHRDSLSSGVINTCTRNS